MIYSFKITNHLGESIFLELAKPEDTGLLITSVSGLGPVKASMSKSEIPTMDGTLMNNVVLEDRNIVFTIKFFEANKEKLSVEYVRHRCYKYFPLKKVVTIEVNNDHGTFKIDGYIESNDIDIFSKEEGAEISIVCPDPYFRKSESASKYLSYVVPNFQFPVSFEAVIENIPDEEEQEDHGSEYIVGPDGTVYFHYVGETEVVSRAHDNHEIPTKNKYLTENITVKKIPYEETEDTSGNRIIKIGGE